MNRNISLDILKLIMAFMIVGLHTYFLGEYSELAEYMAVNGLFRAAVPIFLLINGYYFHPVLQQHKHAIWLKRVFMLYAFWMIVYSYYWFAPSDISILELLKLIKQIAIGYFHLWYLPGLLGAAVILIALNKVSAKLVVLGMLAAYLIGVFIQYAGNYHLMDDKILDEYFNKFSMHRNFLLFSFPFFYIGYLINQYALHEKISKKSVLTLSILGLIALFGESYFNFYQPQREGGFDNMFSLILFCPAIFIYFMKLDISGGSKKLALYSSAVYFIHPLILNILNHLAQIENTVLTMVVIVLSMIASYLLIRISKKYKFIL